MPSNKFAKKILDKSLPCFVCNKQFKSVAILMDHIATHHPSIRLYRCVICPGDKDTLTKYRRHILAHLKAFEKGNAVNHDNTNHNDANLNNIPINLNNDDENLNNRQENFDIVENVDNLHEIVNVVEDLNNIQDNVNSPNIEEKVKELYDTCLMNLLEICSKPDMTFKRAFEFSSIKNQEHIKLIDILKNFIQTKDNSFDDVVKNLENTFSNFNTEFKFLKHLEEIGLYSPPQNVIVGIENRATPILGINEFQEIKDTVCVLNLKFMLKSLFECKYFGEMVFKKYEYYLNNNDGILKNFVQGKIWRDIVQRNPDKIVFPYFLYDDDIEIASPVGHNVSKQSLCIFTIHFPVVEDFLLAKTEFMFPIAIAKTVDTKKYLKDYMLNSLVKTMNELATDGIDIKIGNDVKKVYFILGLATGDNKALNEILGFTGSFIHKYCCRQCIMPIEERSKSIVSDPTLKRNIEDYDDHLNNSDEFGKYGLNRKCNLNNIYEFHVYRNYYSDIFHDVIYLVMKDGLEALIQDGIRKKNLLSMI